MDKLVIQTLIQNKIREHKDNNTFKSYVRWNGALLEKWKYELLTECGAISNRGILSDYPMLEVINYRGDIKNIDANGNLRELQRKKEEIDNSSKNTLKTKILFVAKTYCAIMEVFKERGVEAMKDEERMGDESVKAKAKKLIQIKEKLTKKL